MNKFSVADITPDRFVVKVRRSLALGELRNIVKFSEENGKILISFSQFGTSKIYYDVTPTEGGFTATKASEKIAMTHGVLRNTVESGLTDLMKRLGAVIE